MKEHLDSYNYFVNVGIKKIVRVNSEIRSLIEPEVYLRYLFRLSIPSSALVMFSFIVTHCFLGVSISQV